MAITSTSVNINQARELVSRVIDASICPFVAGPPGIGKSEMLQSIAEERKLKVIDLRLAQCDPTDLN